MNREKVFNEIDKEREYQDGISKNMNHKGHPTIEAEILMLDHYITLAKQSWTTSYGDNTPPLENIRKIAGIATRCLEHHGCPSRVKKIEETKE